METIIHLDKPSSTHATSVVQIAKTVTIRFVFSLLLLGSTLIQMYKFSYAVPDVSF